MGIRLYPDLEETNRKSLRGGRSMANERGKKKKGGWRGARAERREGRGGVGIPSWGLWGFTIVELLIVIAVIMILAGMLFAAFTGVTDKARRTDTEALLAKVDSALRKHKQDFGDYPLSTPPFDVDWTSAPMNWRAHNGLGYLLANPNSSKNVSVANIKQNQDYRYEQYLYNEISDKYLKSATINITLNTGGDTSKPTIIDSYGQAIIYIYACAPEKLPSGTSEFRAWDVTFTSTISRVNTNNYGRYKRGCGQSKHGTRSCANNANRCMPTPESGFEKEFELWSKGKDTYLGEDSSSGPGTKYTSCLHDTNLKYNVDNISVTPWK